jgi:short-subunit dehydrogenase
MRALYITVNNAAIGHFGSILQVPIDDIVNVFNVDVFGPIRLMQIIVPHMPKGGRIINIGSIASKLGLANLPVYGAAKAAMDTLTFSMSQEVCCESTQVPTLLTLLIANYDETAWS